MDVHGHRPGAEARPALDAVVAIMLAMPIGAEVRAVRLPTSCSDLVDDSLIAGRARQFEVREQQLLDAGVVEQPQMADPG